MDQINGSMFQWFMAQHGSTWLNQFWLVIWTGRFSKIIPCVGNNHSNRLIFFRVFGPINQSFRSVVQSSTTNLSVTTKVVRTSAKRTEVHVPFATEGSERLQIAPSAPLVELSLAIPILLRWMVDVTPCCSRETFCSGAFQVGYDLGYDLDYDLEVYSCLFRVSYGP